MLVSLLLTFIMFAPAVLAQTPSAGFLKDSEFDGRPVVVIANDKMELSVAKLGGSMVRLVLQGDSDALSPFGNPERYSGLTPQQKSRGFLGHFVCLDGFGPMSAEERAAGLYQHGEAQRQPWTLVSSEKRGATASVRFSANLPIVHETLTRTIHMVDGENVIYIDSEVQSHLGFDRPLSWGEHGTIGPPFLEGGKTVVDLSGGRSRTRPYNPEDPRQSQRRLSPATDFAWPLAPARKGGVLDMRLVPPNPDSRDHTTTLMDPSRRLSYLTAMNTERGYLLGYLFRRDEYPWVQIYDGYYGDPSMIKAIEFATQYFDLPRREVIQLNSLFGAPLYRWLPGMSKITSRFVMFYTKVPAGMTRVDDVRLENGKIVIEDHAGKHQVVLKASLPL